MRRGDERRETRDTEDSGHSVDKVGGCHFVTANSEYESLCPGRSLCTFLSRQEMAPLTGLKLSVWCHSISASLVIYSPSMQLSLITYFLIAYLLTAIRDMQGQAQVSGRLGRPATLPANRVCLSGWCYGAFFFFFLFLVRTE